MAPTGFIALWTGWITAECGRQPWVVYNLVRTIDAASKITLLHVLSSFITVLVVYGIIFGLFYTFYLRKILMHGPIEHPDQHTVPFNYMPSHSSK